MSSHPAPLPAERGERVQELKARLAKLRIVNQPVYTPISKIVVANRQPEMIGLFLKICQLPLDKLTPHISVDGLLSL
jgi:hypothetical protein